MDKLRKFLITAEEARGFQESPGWLQNFFVLLVVVAFGLSIAWRFSLLAWILLTVALIVLFKLIAKTYK